MRVREKGVANVCHSTPPANKLLIATCSALTVHENGSGGCVRLANTRCQSSPIVAFHVFPRFLGGRIVAAVKAHTRVDERQRESWARS